MGLGLLPTTPSLSEKPQETKGLGLTPSSVLAPEVPQAVSQNAHQNAGLSPDQAVDDQALGKELGLSADLVARNRDTLQKQQERKSLEKAAYQYPGLSKYLANREDLAVSKDDLDSLSQMNELMGNASPDLSFGRVVQGMWQELRTWVGRKASSNVAETKSWDMEDPADVNRYFELASPVDKPELEQRVSELTLDSFISEDEARKVAMSERLAFHGDYWQDISDNPAFQYGEDFKGKSSGYVEDVFRGVAGSAPDMLAMVANPALGATSIFTTMHGAKYNQLIQSGVEEKDAAHAAFVSAAGQTPLEYAGNLVSLNAFGKMIKPGQVKDFVLAVAQSTVGEGLEEYLQNFPDEFASIMAANPDKKPEEWTKELINRLPEIALSEESLYSAAVGAGAGAVFPTAGKAMHAPIDVYRYMIDTQKAQLNVQFFEALDQQATESKTRQRMPEAYERAVSAAIEANGGRVENIYIEASKLQEAVNDDTLLQELLLATGTGEQFQEALVSGGDVVIPTAKYAAKIAGTDISKRLSQDMRLGAEAMSAREAEEFRASWAADTQKEVEALRADKEAADQFETERKQVYDDVLAKRQALGRVAESARSDAEYWAAFATTYARRYGGSPLEVYKQIAPEVGEGTVLNSGGLLQSPTYGNDLLRPLGESRMVGGETVLHEDEKYKVLESDYKTSTSRSVRYLSYEEGKPVGVLQIHTKGKRSKKAVISNVFVEEGSRRKRVAADLLLRARQDFDVKHSTDLTDDGRAFSRADGVLYQDTLGELTGSDKYSNPRATITKVRGGWTKDKIRKELKKGNYRASGKLVHREIARFDSAEEFAENIYYHGTGSYVGKSLKPSITMSEREAERSGGGGYGERYWAVSLSKSKNTASNFTGMSSSGTVYPVILKKNANVISRPDLKDSVELEDIIVELWDQGVDAVKLGDWDSESSEQEIAILNTNAIFKYNESESFQVYGKKKFEELTDEQIKEIYDTSVEIVPQLNKMRMEGGSKEERDAFNKGVGKLLFQTAIQDQTETEEFNEWSGGGEIVEPEDINDHDFATSEPTVLRVFHGTSHEIEEFKGEEFGSLEGHFGALNYFTSSEYDAEKNYAGEGPDLTIRIDQRAEQINDRLRDLWDELEDEQQFRMEVEEDLGYKLGLDANFTAVVEDEFQVMAHNVARAELSGGEELTMELFVKVENPFVIGDDTQGIELVDNEAAEAESLERVADTNGVELSEIEENREDYAEELNEARWEILNETPNVLVEAIQTVAAEYDVEASEIFGAVMDLGDETTPSVLEDLLRSSDELQYAEDPETGKLVGSHIVSQVIKELGYDAIVLRDADQTFSNMGMEPGTTHIHLFDKNNTNIKSATDNVGVFNPEDPNIYAQKQAGTAHGSVTRFNLGETPVVTLFESANASTFLHESGHIFFQFMEQTAKLPGANAQLREDMQAVYEFVGNNGTPPLSVKEHEKLARAFEAYFLEGKAPSMKLRTAFQKFSDWLKALYHRATTLGANITPELQGVFDRMLATDQEIAEAQQFYRAQTPFFAEADMISEEEATQYQKARDDAQIDAEDKRYRKYARAYLEAVGGKKEIEAGVATEVNKIPVYAATDQIVAEGGIPAPVVDQIIGAEARKALGKKRPGLINKNGGVIPDLVAAEHGFNGPLALFEAILQAENKTAAKEKAVDERMAKIQKDMRDGLAEGSLAADPDYHSDAQLAVLAAEVQMLKRRRVAPEKSPVPARSSNKVLFLDIDGVLNHNDSNEILPELVVKLNKLLAATDAGIVVSSTWRISGYAAMEEMLVEAGVNAEGRVLGVTPELNDQRGDEIRSYLDANGKSQNIENVVVLDDRTDLDTMSGWQVTTNPEIGLTDANINDAISRLQRGDSARPKTGWEQAKDRRIETAAVREVARQVLLTKSVREASSYGRYSRAEAKAAKQSREAYEAGDLELADKMKRRELLNHALVLEAVQVREMVQKGLKYAKASLTTQATRADAHDQLMDLTARFGMTNRRAGESIEQRLVAVREELGPDLATLKEWLSQMEEIGYPAQLEDFLLHSGFVKDYRDLSYHEFTALIDGLKTIRTIDRQERMYLSGEEAITLEAVEEELLTTLDENYAGVDKSNTLQRHPTREGLAGLNAIHTKMETLFRTLDGKELGPWWNFLFRPIANAEDARAMKLKEATLHIQSDDLFGRYSMTERTILFNRKVKIEGVMEPLTKSQIIAAALNVGNPDNKAKLQEGYGWTDAQLQKVLDQLDQRDWDFVQATWDYIDTFWPEAEKLQKDITGRAPKKVVARPVKTKYGEFAGGYYPIVFDSRLSFRAFQREQKDMDKFLFGGRNYGAAMTQHGHLKERQDSAGGQAVTLDLQVIPNHIFNTIHDVTHRRAVLDVAKVIRRPNVQEALDRAVGNEMSRELMPWLQDVAREYQEPMHAVHKFARWARGGTTIMNMGFKLTTMFTQPVGYTQTIDRLGMAQASKGLAMFYGGPNSFSKIGDRIQYVMDRSPFMVNRMKSFDRDIRDQLKTLTPGTKALAEVRRFAFTGIGLFQMGVDMPTWYAAYDKGMKEFEGNEKRAIELADSTVRLTQGAGGTKDLARVQRGGELMRMFTMFYSYFNTLYNLASLRFSETKGVKDVPALAASALWLWFAPTLLSELVAGRGPDDDEELKDWAIPQLIMYPFQAIVGVRDMANYAFGEFGYQITPAQAAPKEVVDWFKAVQNAIEEEDPGAAIGQTVESIGYIAKLPMKQLVISVGNVWDYATGEDPEFEIRDLFFRKRSQ